MLQGVVSSSRAFPGGRVVKNPSANAGDARDEVSIPGSGWSPGEGNGNPLQYPCLGNPMGKRRLAGYNGVTKSQTQLSNTHTHTHINTYTHTHTHTHTHTSSSSSKGIYSPNSRTYFPAFIGYLGTCWISIIRKGEEVCYNREEIDFGIQEDIRVQNTAALISHMTLGQLLDSFSLCCPICLMELIAILYGDEWIGMFSGIKHLKYLAFRSCWMNGSAAQCPQTHWQILG